MWLILIACMDYDVIDQCEDFGGLVVCWPAVPVDDAADVCDSRGLVLADIDPPRQGDVGIDVADALPDAAWLAGDPCRVLSPSGAVGLVLDCAGERSVVCSP